MKSFARNVLILALVLSVFLIDFSLAADKTISEVEGIFYLDKKPVSIEVVNGLISKIVYKDSIDNPVANIYIAPGMIDHQVNGYLGISFGAEELGVEDVRKITKAVWKTGITTYLPTLTTNSRERLLRNFVVLAKAMEDAEIGDSIPGFHLEGPYISPVEGYRGAHDQKWIKPPDWQEFSEFKNAANNKIIEVTIAPEIDGAIDFIRNCTKEGIVIGIGHSAASTEDIKRAVEAGAVVSTHLGNGCANVIHRHNNPLWQQLADDRLTASIIVDGFHLRPEQVQTFFKVKGTERTILVSDVSYLAGMPPGEYTAHGRTVVMTPEGMIRMPSQDVLAGASLPVSVGVGNMMRFTNCSLADAIHMASRNPANLLGLNDRGEIKVGKRADLVLFTIDDGKLNIKKTIVAGKVVFSAGDDQQ
jgi:N-acetylglucosamine-6-phosphate deacetylase